jgi:hypothetical protein
MQTLIAILIVLGAIAYVAWQWMPVKWRAVMSMKRVAVTQPVASTCGACATCGACGKANM